MTTQQRFRGCLLGGAVGDALGAPVEFLSKLQITERFGPAGIRDYVPAYGRLGAITDDTQMTLFTAEAMLRWHADSEHDFSRIAANAYQRWLETQGYTALSTSEPGWLISHKELFSPRAPGNTCLSALRAARSGRAQNNSKGCGGVMRAAPVGLWLSHNLDSSLAGLAHVFELGLESAALTHGHPSGFLTSGVLAVLIALLARGTSLRAALPLAKDQLKQHAEHRETLDAIEAAEHLAPQPQAALEALGEGWVAEEALAISLYCALRAANFAEGLILAVNHGGDSDSTGSITGNLLGCEYGESQIPEHWLHQLELRPVITQMADDLADAPQWTRDNTAEWQRYPPN